MICTRCGTTFKKPKRHMPGSLVTVVLLWLLFIIPGAIYTAWRYIGVKQACPACGSDSMVPSDSPVGRRMLAPRCPKCNGEGGFGNFCNLCGSALQGESRGVDIGFTRCSKCGAPVGEGIIYCSECRL